MSAAREPTVHHRCIVFGEIEKTGRLYLGFMEDVELPATHNGKLCKGLVRGDFLMCEPDGLCWTAGMIERQTVGWMIAPKDCRANVLRIVSQWKFLRAVPLGTLGDGVRETTYPVEDAFTLFGYPRWRGRA